MSGADGHSRLRVELGARGYDIVIGRGLIADAARWLAPVLNRPRIAVVTDTNVAARHLPAFLASARLGGIAAEAIVLGPGEASKTYETFGELLDRLLELRIERRDTLVALGGGVIGDLTGFAASVLRRGVEFVQAPTTLLAQVDSSVGGKTGINSRHGKNLIGSFHQPKLVLADTGALDTLPRRELLAGYAEVAKYGLLGDAGFFDWLEAHGAALLAGDDALRRHAIETSCRMKAAIVARDEREDGDRALLNLGHTFGHAFEAATGFSDRLLHGEAVAIGMTMAFRLSARLGLCPGQDALRAERHLAAVGLPTRPPPGQPETFFELMKQDKKVADGRMTFILARGIGDAFITREVDPADVIACLRESQGELAMEAPNGARPE